MTEGCCLVYPVWRQIGTVKWDGQANREPLMAIEYRQCSAESTVRLEGADGFAFEWCNRHARERIKTARVFP
jgi:hypothetical protein